MATRKQRRRREKDMRHEFVWEDDAGNPIEPPAKEERAPRGKADAKGGSSRGRQPRAIQPPSWQRVAKRAAIFGPLMLLLVFVLPAKGSSRGATLATALIFIAIFIPFSYLMDSMMWRSYQKRLNKPPKDEARGAGKGR